MKKVIISSLALALSIAAGADTLDVKTFRHEGPYQIKSPYIIDSLNVNGDKYETKDSDKLHILEFALQTDGFAKAELKLEGAKDFTAYLDREEIKGNELKLEPATHEIKLEIRQDSLDSLKIRIICDKPLVLRQDGLKRFCLDANTRGESLDEVSISANGKYAQVCRKLRDSDGDAHYSSEIIRLSDRKVLFRTEESVEWLYKSDEYSFIRINKDSGIDLIACDPESGVERIIARDIPSANYTLAPTEDFLILSDRQEGPKEGNVHQILNPEDRQSGWRDRSNLQIYDFATHTLQDLTYGHHNAHLCDISRDGSRILFLSWRERFEQRPTTLYSLYQMNLETREVEQIVKDDGFITNALYSPDGKEIAMIGSAEAFGGFAEEIKEGQTPNQYQKSLFIMDLASKNVRTLTKGFTPSVQRIDWSGADGKIYFDADDKDCTHLFRVDPKTAKIEKLDNREDMLRQFDLAWNVPSIVYFGESLTNADRAYVFDTRKLKNSLLAESRVLEGYQLGEGLAYEFKSTKGDLINCFYVLPPDFDSSKKYPMIVHYYGGCNPSTRYCIGSYSPQYYAAQGYVFLVVNPSGASGFGQEFAARHVNTAGEGVAEDIIEAVERFCGEHGYVDTKHIGCFSASYGGFMTQLLLTKTDMFATGISHAGISSHTSYWGEGYWGYSYSEVAMANSYPWNRKDLYVERSPLYNADKIHTPLLFLHGSKDTNVPIGESIQMFTALKLLGQDTAFVVVDGENHGIREYAKRRDWLRTISAWFAKYLKEDSGWWDEMYPEKNL